MKFLPLILENMKRKKVRLVLTIGSYAVALFLFGLLTVIENAFYQGIDIAGADRLVVRNKTSLIMPLPLSYKERLLQIDGVDAVTHANWFGGVYQDPRNFFPQFAIDTETYRDMYPEFKIKDEQWETFLKDQQGAIVGKKILNKYGWKIGDKIPIQATYYEGTWDFNICGVYEGTRQADDETQFWFHFKYLDERSPFEKGYVGWYVVRVHNPEEAVSVIQAIDDRFANSPFETMTETESEFAAGFVKQFGNIRLILISVGSVVFFTLLLISGSNMGLAIRERTHEIGVLKTIGFSDVKILLLILLEASSYALTGGVLGLLLCKLMTLGGDPTGGMLPVFYLSMSTILLGVIVTFMVGIISGLIPALNGMNLKIVDAMRRL